MPKNFKELINQNNKTAYELSKLFCRFRVDQGRDIPTVSEIHEELGKGSVRDIAKALAEFKSEQIEFKQMVDELEFDELPAALTRLVKEQWLLAKEIASTEFNEQLSQANQKIVKLKKENKKLKEEIKLLKKEA